MNIDTAYYGYLTEDKQKKKFYKVKKLEKITFKLYKWKLYKTHNIVKHYTVIPFGKWYIGKTK